MITAMLLGPFVSSPLHEISYGEAICELRTCYLYCSVYVICILCAPFVSMHFVHALTTCLGAAADSPYIVFISTSGMLRSSDIYIYIYTYIYIICIHTQVLQHTIYTQIYITLKQNGYFSRRRISFRSVTPP